MKSLLITGTSGFIGKNLMRIIEKDFKDEFYIFLLNDIVNEKYKTILYDDAFHFCETELSEIGKIDIIIILGGGVPRTNEQKNDILFNYRTFDSTFYLLNHLCIKPEKIVYCSTVDVYGNSGFDVEYDPTNAEIVSENTFCHPNDQYSVFKYLSELFIIDYCKHNHIAFEVLRFGPVFGPGDSRKKFLVSVWLNNAKDGKDLVLFGHPLMKRNLIFVDDVCYFVINAIYCEDNEIINIVSKNNYSLKEIASTIANNCGNSIRIIEKSVDRFYGRDRIFDASKRISLLGEERYSLKEAIIQTLK